MAGTITVTQAYSLGALSSQGGTLAYVIQCTASGGVYPTQAEVLAAVQAVVPSNSAMLGSYGWVVPLDDLRIDHLTDALWTAEATFKRPQSRDRQPEQIGGAEGPVLDFDIGGASQHISTSKGQTGYALSGLTPYDPKNVIGWDGKKVNGVDTQYGVYRFSEEWILPDAAAANAVPCKCDANYRAWLAVLAFKTNHDPFRGFAAGEVLFEGAVGRRIKGGAYAVTYKFLTSKNATNLTIGDITGIAKKGWQYLDVRMKTVTAGSGASTVILSVPEYVFVHDIYDSGDFSALQIGTDAI